LKTYISKTSKDVYDKIKHLDSYSVFWSMEWHNVMRRTYGFCPMMAIGMNGDVIEACFPYIKVEVVPNVNKIVVFPFSDYCNPYFKNEDAFWELLDMVCEQEHSDAIVRLLDTQVLSGSGKVSVIRRAVVHQLDLSGTGEELWTGLHRKFRNHTRKAQKADVEYGKSCGLEDVLEFWELHAILRKNKFVEFPQPREFFRCIHDELFTKGKGFLLWAKKDGKMIAGTIFLVDGNTGYYKFSASNQDYLEHCPNNGLCWEGIVELKKRGCKIMDMGLSGLSPAYRGLLMFKDRTGAKRIPLEFCRYSKFGFDFDPNVIKDIKEFGSELVKGDISLDQIDLFSSYFYRQFA